MDHQQNTGEVRIVSAQVLAQLQAAGYQVFVTQNQNCFLIGFLNKHTTTFIFISLTLVDLVAQNAHSLIGSETIVNTTIMIS